MMIRFCEDHEDVMRCVIISFGLGKTSFELILVVGNSI